MSIPKSFAIKVMSFIKSNKILKIFLKRAIVRVQSNIRKIGFVQYSFFGKFNKNTETYLRRNMKKQL